MNKDYYQIPVTIYNISEQISPTLTKGRVRIFYKYENRNGSYISDEFAEKLISSLPYAPIKGIYDSANNDYTDHGPSNEYGRIYGVVPKDMNFAWEEHLDDDGVTRTYATADVYIYSAMYKEANDILGKSQSMELFPPSIKGEWVSIKGQRYFKFSDGCFFGLQVLGDKTEPCFEGASFFTLSEKEQREKLIGNMFELMEMLDGYIKKYSYGGNSNMELNFKVSDRQKFDAIWSLLNPNFNEEGGYEVAFSILDIYDDYALAFDYEHNCYARVAYTKDNENDMVSIGEITPCYVLDVTESEKAVLETLRAANGGTYELVDEKFNSGMSAIEEKASLNEEIEKRDATISEYSTKITELEETISTLNSDRDNMATEFEKVQGDVATLTAENESLKAYKAKIEKENKQRVIESYSSMLSNEIIENYTARIDEYSNEIDLDKDLAYELKNSNISVFANAPTLIPQPEEHIGGLAELLSKYKNK